MNAIVILIPVTLALAVVAVGVFFWAVNHHQFEDLDTPKILPLTDAPPRLDHQRRIVDGTPAGTDRRRRGVGAR